MRPRRHALLASTALIGAGVGVSLLAAMAIDATPAYAGDDGDGGSGSGGTDTLTFTQSAAVTVTSAITGSSSITQSGAGTLTLTGSNTYTGATTVASGGLIVDSGGSITQTSSVTVSSGGSFTVSSGGTVSVGSGGIVNSGGGTVAVSNGVVTTVGAVTNGGTVTVEGAAGSLTTSGIVNSSGGTLTVSSGATLSVGSGGIVNSGGGTVTVSNGVVTTVGAVTNGGTVTVAGAAGSVTTSGIVNSVGGTFTVSSGSTVSVGAGGIANSGTFTVSNGTVTTVGAVTNGGAVTVAGAAGTLTASGGITNSVGGTITVSSGSTVSVGAGGIANSGTFTVSNGTVTTVGAVTNGGTVTVAGAAGTLTASGGITNSATGTITVSSGATVTAALVNNGGTVTNAGTWTGSATNSAGTLANLGTWIGTISNAGTFTNAAAATVSGGLSNTVAATNSGTITGAVANGGTFTNTGTVAGGLTNSATVLAQGTIAGGITNTGPGTFTVTGALSAGNGNFTNGSGATLTVGNNQFTGINALTNSAGGTIDVASGTLGTVTASNAGTVVATGSMAAPSTITGAFTNQAGGVIDLTKGASPLTNQLTIAGSYQGVGAAGGLPASAVNLQVNLGNAVGVAPLLNVTGNTSGTTALNYNIAPGTLVVLGGPTEVIKAGGGNLAPTGVTENFGLVNVSVASDGHGGAELLRTTNTGAIAAPGASIMAALASIDTSFHQSTAPFVASPQSQSPDQWTGGVWSRATAGQTTTKSVATDLTGPAGLRVKTTFDAYEVGIDTGRLNVGNTGWNAHFGIMAGAVTANANELLSGSGTMVKFDVPFAGVYGVLTNGPLFMDLEYRHDWIDTHITNVTAGLSNAELKGDTDSVSGSAGYRFNLPKQWFIEPSAGFSFSQTAFGALGTNPLGGVGIAPGSINFDTLSSFLVRAGARFGTSVQITDTFAVQPFATLSVWHEFAGQSNSVFSQPGGTPDPVNLSRVGTFYQAGLGASAQVNTNVFGFIRGDVRWGDNLNGSSIVGGLRYNFAP